MINYQLKPQQKKMIEDIKKLNSNRLYYVVIQSDENYPNYTLNELKKHIRYTIKQYIKQFLSYKYKEKIENEIIQYYCIFETTKEFQLNQLKENLFNDELYMGLHFHLFISSKYSDVYIPQIIHNLFMNLTLQKLKNNSLKKFDYDKLTKLEERFIQYHTKQFYWNENPEMIMKNL